MHEAEAVRLGIGHLGPPNKGTGLSFSFLTIIHFEAAYHYGAAHAINIIVLAFLCS